ncbi:alpha/beta hydrolase [Shewanella sp. 202IG2-18]|uniref:alpha/beta fold hydrolase n=1 Tax=Parashewanella hymeniacidonis TaxID=2807618 RepID=UPI00196119FD|nr:alpha/beta hydrolase [Parashewanella hymeniacidonis]MBM7070587.1 alpha/beta hydrolase [Parashewanella hymeniacidonis]
MFKEHEGTGMPSEMLDENTGTNIVYLENHNANTDIWLIHGFTECSDSLKGIFDTSIAKQCNVFIPDLPGFGKSRFEEKYFDLNNIVTLLEQLISVYSSGRPLIILGHSLGATIATILTAKLDNVVLFLNVEGMLVEDDRDARSLTKASEFDDSVKFVEYMCSRLKTGAESNAFVKRYLENIKRSDPNIIHDWAKSSTELLAANHIDLLYKSLKCQKLYIHGEYTMSRLELEHLKKAEYERVIIKEAGHWPMLEQAGEFWKIISEILSEYHG